MREPRFEALWYEGKTEEEAFRNDPKTKEFYTQKSAMNFYEEHKDDAGKYGWWVTHRDADWGVIEDLVY